MATIKCTKCHEELNKDMFHIFASGRVAKQCKGCNKYHRKVCENNFCTHGKDRAQCMICDGKGLCDEHNNPKNTCRLCGNGTSLCEHGTLKRSCAQCRNSSAYCIHNKRRSRCRQCNGSDFCIHSIRKGRCRQCNGSEFCIHQSNKYKCRICNIIGYIRHCASVRINEALRGDKDNSCIKYLGCSIEHLKEHLEKQFTDEMNWENHGPFWHIDHIIPIMYDDPTKEEVIERLHYTNTQPLKASDNMSKGNRFYSPFI